MEDIKVLFIVQSRDDRSMSGVGYIPIGLDTENKPHRLVDKLYHEIKPGYNGKMGIMGNLPSSSVLSAESSRYVQEKTIEVCERLGITFGGMF
jgi:hypothetical protein